MAVTVGVGVAHGPRSGAEAIGARGAEENVRAATEGVAPSTGVRRPSVSVIIPTLNEAQNLPHVLPAIPSDIYEVILVDGRSVDGTVKVAQELLPSIRVVL
ncbi:MAG: glycosyltransferase, partial [Chloroflexota bacterium]